MFLTSNCCLLLCKSISLAANQWVSEASAAWTSSQVIWKLSNSSGCVHRHEVCLLAACQPANQRAGIQINQPELVCQHNNTPPDSETSSFMCEFKKLPQQEQLQHERSAEAVYSGNMQITFQHKRHTAAKKTQNQLHQLLHVQTDFSFCALRLTDSHSSLQSDRTLDLQTEDL